MTDMNYTSNENPSSPWIAEDRRSYGYRVNILHPYIYPIYQRFRKKNNIPSWCPLSDDERFEFELAVIPHLEKKFRCKAPPPNTSPRVLENLPLELIVRIYGCKNLNFEGLPIPKLNEQSIKK